MMTQPIRTNGLPTGCVVLATMLMAMLVPLQAAVSATPGERGPAAGNREQLEQQLQDAQQRLDQAAREMADLSLALGDAGTRIVRHSATEALRRPMLGMAVDMHDSSEGVRIASVSPGGGAEAAGIRANDIIVSLDGKALRGDANQSAQQQLLSIARAAKPGQPVVVEYRRDGKPLKAQIVPSNMRDSLANLPFTGVPLPPGAGTADLRMFRFMGRDGNGFGSAELVELTPALGGYFGTDKGLLIVRAPRDQRFKLQDGDVLLDIDGRVPGSVSHAVQILQSYRAGETAKLHIMRQKKRLELSVAVPTEAAKVAGEARELTQ